MKSATRRGPCATRLVSGYLIVASLFIYLFAPARTHAAIASHLTHYGLWKDADIAVFQRFGLVALQAGHYDPASGEAQAIARIRANGTGANGSTGTKVLLYVSIGEDAATFNQGPPARGDGRGPVRWNAATGAPVYANRGIASYYLDEWNAQGPGSDSSNKVPDGLPDRQGDWGSCLVNAGDPAWQDRMLAEAARLMALGADGLFLDTPETANPWLGYAWTAPGMHDLIRKLREAHPTKYILLNRGLFFFDPDFPLHYRWNPRLYLDGVLFESYYTGSNYLTDLGGNGQWRLNPYFASHKHLVAPKLNAEMNRPGSRGTVFHLDYAAAPLGIAQDLPNVFQTIRQEAIVEQGWVPQINDRLLSQLPTAFLDNPAPPDRSPPVWRSTTGFLSAQGEPPPPRIGALKAIPGNGKVTLRWDVAADQTWPVRYNIYYTRNAPLDFATATRLAHVATEVGVDYADRVGSGAEDGCPYEFTVTGLTNQSIYRFAVRAEDATVGAVAQSGQSGRIGPGGGIEETNGIILMAIPRDSTPFPIAIDGDFADWNAVPILPDSAGDGSGTDLLEMAVTDDRDNLYVSLRFAATANAAQTVLLFNADRRSHTGDISPVASGFKGADFKWEGGSLFRHQNWSWVRTAAVTASRLSGNRIELRLAKQDLGITAATGLDLLATTLDRREFAPEKGLTGFAYGFTYPTSTNALVRPGHFAKPNLSLHREGNRVRVFFPNSKQGAILLVSDLSGKHVLRQKQVTEGEWVFTIPPASASAAAFILQVQAEGEILARRLFWQVNP
jgi:hypothetical protein